MMGYRQMSVLRNGIVQKPIFGVHRQSGLGERFLRERGQMPIDDVTNLVLNPTSLVWAVYHFPSC